MVDRMEKWVPCPICKGTGKITLDCYCKKCSGAGLVREGLQNMTIIEDDGYHD